MDDGRIDVREESGVRTLTIDRPARRNALTASMYAALADGLGVPADASAAEGPTAGRPRAIVLAAAGDAFCAGNDLEDFMARAGEAGTIGADSPQGRLLHALAVLPCPLVVAVDGAAIGIGFTALLHADVVVATPAATFGAPFGQLGLCPEAGSSLLLPRLVGRQKALEMFLLGRRLDAEETLAAGLVNRIVPPDALAATAREYAEALAALPPEAVRATRRLVSLPEEPLPVRIDRELDAFSGCLATEETRERIAAVRARLAARSA